VLGLAGFMVVEIAQQGGGHAKPRSSSCGARQRSMGRRQRSCGAQGGARSTGQLRKPQQTSAVQRPPEEVDLRQDVPLQESEEGLTIVCDLIADWVDVVANDIQEQPVLTVLDADLWETMSAGSFEDWDSEDPVDFAVDAEDPEAIAAPPAPGNEERVVMLSPPPSFLSPMASPSSRSSTPSRSVRHRRRVIGGVVRPLTPAWDAAKEAPPRPQAWGQTTPSWPDSTMKRAASTSALALDLGIAHDKLPSTPFRSSGRSCGLAELCKNSGLDRKCVKSKSLGSLLLPALSDQQHSKADLIAWSMSMTKTKRGGLSLVF